MLRKLAKWSLVIALAGAIAFALLQRSDPARVEQPTFSATTMHHLLVRGGELMPKGGEDK